MPSSLLALFFAVVVAPSAWADTSTSTDYRDSQLYGNCFVTTTVDMFTDAEAFGFVCKEETLSDETLIGVVSAAGALIVMLGKGVQFHMPGAAVPVAIRIDKGRLIKSSTTITAASHVEIHDSELAHALLSQLAQGQRVAVQVGRETGHVRLKGSERAIADFRQRAGLSQQTLTIEQRRNLPASIR